MIVLDTNVLAETLKPSPSDAVLHWLAAQEALTTFTTAITQAEILYGIALMPPGKRRSRLTSAVEKIFAEEFQDRILPFDKDAAREFATIAAGRQSAGRPTSQMDAMIAAIARSFAAAVATRNTADFDACGIRLIDPWTD